MKFSSPLQLRIWDSSNYLWTEKRIENLKSSFHTKLSFCNAQWYTLSVDYKWNLIYELMSATDVGNSYIVFKKINYKVKSRSTFLYFSFSILKSEGLKWNKVSIANWFPFQLLSIGLRVLLSRINRISILKLEFSIKGSALCSLTTRGSPSFFFMTFSRASDRKSFICWGIYIEMGCAGRWK